jgi:hypothetical protein
MGEIGKIRDETKFWNEGDKIYAFKPQPHRFLSFFIEGRKILLLLMPTGRSRISYHREKRIGH